MHLNGVTGTGHVNSKDFFFLLTFSTFYLRTFHLITFHLITFQMATFINSDSDMESAMDNLTLTEEIEITGGVHAVSEDVRSSTGFLKVAFAAHVDNEETLYLVHVYGDYTMFTIGNMLTLANATWDGRVLSCCQSSNVYR